MKRNALAFLTGLAFALGIAHLNAKPAPAQLGGTPTLTCDSSGDCGQYLLEIDTQRGFGPAFKLYQVPTTAIDTSGLTLVNSGYPSISFQADEPGTRSSQSFTVTAGEP